MIHFLLDVSPDPISPVGMLPLLVLLGIAFVLSVACVSAIVFALILYKRKKNSSQSSTQ